MMVIKKLDLGACRSQYSICICIRIIENPQECHVYMKTAFRGWGLEFPTRPEDPCVLHRTTAAKSSNKAALLDV